MNLCISCNKDTEEDVVTFNLYGKPFCVECKLMIDSIGPNYFGKRKGIKDTEKDML
jgi:hypothetical protein